MRYKVLAIIVGSLLVPENARSEDVPSISYALQFRPIQQDVLFETPPASEFNLCRIKVEKQGKLSGWVVYGPQGQILRKYIDTNADGVVDQWRYYNRGLEVYRDIDSNFNAKVDQTRWLNVAGSRWGIDSNEDKRIDSWKILSAEEATRVAVNALISGDEQALRTVLINQEDIRKLGIARQFTQKLLAASTNTATAMRAALTRSKSITRQSRWHRFDAAMPSLIPADEGKASSDLTVYENALAWIQTGQATTLVQIGEIVRVGEVWKLASIPSPLDGNTVQMVDGGVLMQPLLVTATTTASAVAPEQQKLLEQLAKLDQSSPSASGSAVELTRYNTARSGILRNLILTAKTAKEQDQWKRQMVDGLTSAVQTVGYTDGVKQLRILETEANRQAPNTPFASYVTYRRLLAEYSLGMQTSDSSQQSKVQKEWYQQLENFVKSFPKAEDSAEAMIQLAISHELTGKLTEAQKWYRRLVTDYDRTPAAVRAAGAMRRLALPGKKLSLSGKSLTGGKIDVNQFRGRVVLVSYWATWCQPCTEDLPQLRAVYEQYRKSGFEIIGVNLDMAVDSVGPFLRQHRISWPQIHQAGGLESPPAQSFGIISLPTMFLIDRTGTVVSRNISVAELKERLPELLK